MRSSLSKWLATAALVSITTVLAMVTPMSGIQGWYADPDIRVYDGTFWIFPTTSIGDQTYFDAWSSPDLLHWQKHPNILVTDDISWATDQLWAPTSVKRHDKFWLYFSANGLRTNTPTAGIGVAVADAPSGPFKDALGDRLIDTIINNANPMDPDIFVDDDDDQIYLYYGGTSVNVALLNKDMISFQSLPGQPNDTYFKELTPTPKFVEGTKVFKRHGIYYMMWSENGYGDPTYQVSYGTANSPLGPFEVKGTILQQDPKVAVATGHNSVLNLPGTDDWYIVYHRRARKEKNVNNRVLAYDRMYFNEDGTIQPVKILK